METIVLAAILSFVSGVFVTLGVGLFVLSKGVGVFAISPKKG